MTRRTMMQREWFLATAQLGYATLLVYTCQKNQFRLLASIHEMVSNAMAGLPFQQHIDTLQPYGIRQFETISFTEKMSSSQTLVAVVSMGTVIN